MLSACSVRVSGVVQGVGFRPFVYRLAVTNGLRGCVRNGERGVEIFVEGEDGALDRFLRELQSSAPPAAHISGVDVTAAKPSGLESFVIARTEERDDPTVPVSADLAVCEQCLKELFDPTDGRYLYPYINCTNCGPRYTVILGLPYDRPKTTMERWAMDSYCRGEYEDPANRRFHAQPVACPKCGPSYVLRHGETTLRGSESVVQAAALLRDGLILAVKGLGGYHLACDARNAKAVLALRERKFRKEKPFAVMARDLPMAHQLVDLSAEEERMLTGVARPIVLAKARVELVNVAPKHRELGIMLPYTPLHHLLFAADAPGALVMTSGNRSSEPIVYVDDEALEALSGIADAFLVGERPIARRVDDSVMRIGAFGPAVLRRARGLAPSQVTTLPVEAPVLALGGDLKSSITLVVDGQAFVSQYIGDLEHHGAHLAFEETVLDLLSMYRVDARKLLVVHDAHPQYQSAIFADKVPCARKIAVQHHRAHIASVLAEQQNWEEPVLGISFDGSGYGDDGTIWGGEFFAGSLRDGFERAASLRQAVLPGGDAAARAPVIAAAGFLHQLENLPDLGSPPFAFPSCYKSAAKLVHKRFRAFPTTSMGRLFDTVAALVGFTRKMSYEGQAAMWMEFLASQGIARHSYLFPFKEGELDFRPLLSAIVDERRRGVPVSDIARTFQRSVAEGVAKAARQICNSRALNTVVLSGGVFQNELLLHDIKELLESSSLRICTNHAVPANDGGISLGQAAIAIFQEQS